MNETLSLIINRLKENKKLYLLLLIPFFIFSYWFYTSYLSKATLNVITDGPGGLTKVYIRELDKDTDEIVKEGREVTAKLNSGKYRVTSVIYSKNQEGEFDELSTSKNIDLSPRQNQNININVSELPDFASVDIKDPPSSLVTSGESLYVSTVYGVVTVHNLLNSSTLKIRNEPAFLSRVAGICPFSNGNSVAVDINGVYYAISNGSAKAIDMASGLSLEELENLEIKPSGFINGTRNLICQNEKATFFGVIEISSGFSKKFVSRDSKMLQRLNYQKDEIGNIWLFDSVNSDSFDHDSTSNSFNKDIILVKPDGQESRYESNDYISGITTNKSGLVCAYYKSKISCKDPDQERMAEVFSHPNSQDITNIALDDSGNIYYSAGGAAWRLNLQNGESSIVFNSKLKISPRTMVYSSELKKLNFVTEKSINSDEQYFLRILSL